MKVTITDGLVIVEDGPAADPGLSDDDGYTLSLLSALGWAAASIMATAEVVQAGHLLRQQLEATKENSAPRGGLH